MDIKTALRTLWKDTCSIIEYEEYTKENRSAGHREVTVLENEPCKLSFETLQSVNQTESAAELILKAKLFLDETVTVRPGSKIVVTGKNGKVFTFSQSGEPGVFTNHQEIPLSPFEEYT